jgi:hypothetical protein
MSTRFHVLGTSLSNARGAVTEYALVDSPNRGEAPRCPVCGGYVGMIPVMPPISAELGLWGRSYGDFAFGPILEFLVSERFKDAFLGAGLSGLPTFAPVRVVKTAFRRGRVKDPAPNYFLVLPIRSPAAIDIRASGMEHDRRVTCQTCRLGLLRRYQRIVVEDGTWSGEDIFFARGLPGTILTSERFKTLCDRHAFTNCELIEAEHYGYDLSPGGGRLRRE